MDGASGRFCSPPAVPFPKHWTQIVVTYLLYGLLLAQADGAAPAAPGGQGAPGAGASGIGQMLLPLVAIMVLFYFLLIRPQKRKEQELRRMVENLKDNDRVITIGGIYGVVTNVQREAQRVTVRVDEGTGAKIRVGMSAIARVVTDDDQEGAGSSGGKS